MNALYILLALPCTGCYITGCLLLFKLNIPLYRFNFIAKKLYKRIIQLGGQPMQGLALADDQHDLG